MLAFLVTIVLLASASAVNGLSLEHIENGQICTSWVYVTGEAIDVDPTPCSSSVGYQIKQYLNKYIIRYCCTYKAVVDPDIGPAPGVCGRQAVTPIRTRIVGGQKAVPYSWPWLVSLQFDGNHFCGGTLIDEYHVLTAAHCLQDQDMYNSRLTVVAGLYAQSQLDPQRIQRKQIANIINHVGYDENTNKDDIAIIRLTSPVTLNSYVNFACLPGTDPAINENVIVAGWGTTSFEGNLSDDLLQANVLVMDVCQYVYDFDVRKQICAGNPQYTKDSCQGDSGGPLMYEVNGQWTLSGVVSYGDECAKLYYPGVYTRVSYYTPWIRSVISALSGK
jgi:secreted trypsin-like serine protease